MEVPENRHDPVDRSAIEPDRKRKKTNTELEIMTGIGVVNERFKCCWEQILNYIPRLDDIFALSKSCSSLQSIVEMFVKKANPDLTIDVDCLDRYPLRGRECDHLYQWIGPLVKTLTVYKITGHQLKWLSLNFKNIRELHLVRMIMEYDEDLDALFPHLLLLKVTDSAIHNGTFCNILAAVKSILHLHINNSTIADWFHNIPCHNNGTVIPKLLRQRTRITDDTRSSPTNYGRIRAELAEFTHFSQLTLERVSLEYLGLNDYTTDALRIVNCDESVTMTRILGREALLKLKSLTLETMAAVRDFVDNASDELNLDSLESLTLTHLLTPLDWLAGLEKLKELKILLPIQNCQQMALIEALSAMENEIDVKYIGGVYPEPAVNEILNVLNQDCLREIVSYLTLDEVFNLAMVHPRFKEVVSSIDLSSLGISVTIDNDFRMRHPLQQELIGYEAVGHSLSTVTLSCSEVEFKTLGPCFPHLRKIISHFNGNLTDQAVEVFPPVEDLAYRSSFRIPKNILRKLLLKLQPSLRVLHGYFETVDFEFVQHLNNLKEFGISYPVLNEDLREFWKRNESLEMLDLLLCFDFGQPTNFVNQQRNWKEIGNLKNLSVLKVEGTELTEFFPKLEQIKELALIDISTYVQFLNSTGGQLELLTVSCYNLMPGEIFAMISRFKNLRGFEFDSYEDLPLSVSQVIRLLIELPKLSLIKIARAPITFYRDLEDLQKFLSTENRVLYFNGVKYPQ